MPGLVGEHELVDAVPVGDAEGDAEPQGRVVAAVVGELGCTASASSSSSPIGAPARPLGTRPKAVSAE